MGVLDEGIFQNIIAIEAFTIEGRSNVFGFGMWDAGPAPFTATADLDNPAPATWKNKIMRGGTTATEWDFRNVPQAGTDYNVFGFVRNPPGSCGLSFGPFYLENGTLVTPAQRPCRAANPTNPASGPWVEPNQAFARPDLIGGLVGLPSYSTAYCGITFTGGPGSGDGGEFEIDISTHHFPGTFFSVDEQIQVTWVATETVSTIASRLASNINTSSSLFTATAVGAQVQCVPVPAKPAYIRDFRFLDFDAAIGAGYSSSTIIATAAPTRQWDVGSESVNDDGEAISFYVPE